MDITPPDNVNYGKVVWRVGVDVNDTDDLGSKPDLVPPTGYVTFVSSVGKLLNPTAAPDPLTMLRYPIVGVIDEEGYLCTPDLNNKTPDYPKGVPAYRGVELIATDDPDLNPLNPTYTVEYKLKGPDGVPLAYPQPHKIAVLTDEIVDLTSFIPPDNPQAIGIPQATALAAAAAAAAESADQRADAAQASAALAASKVIDSAEFVGDEIADPTSPAAVAVAAKLQPLAPKVNPAFSATVGLPGGASGNPRLPVNGAPTMNGATLPAGTSDKVLYAFSGKFNGGFTAEAGYSQVNPTFLFGMNAFFVTGSAAGDLAGINDVYGFLGEWHTYTPGAALTKQYAGQFETALEASAVGATVADLMSLYAQGPKVKAGTAAQAISFRFDQPETSGAGTITGLKLGLWGRGSALFEGLTPNAQATRKGVWVGGGAASGGDPAIELADGTNTWRIDNTAGALRFLKAGVEQVAGLDLSGNLDLKRSGGGMGQLRARTIVIGEDGFAAPTKTGQGRLTVYGNAAASTPMYVQGFAGQTADLQRWQNSSGQALARVHALGALITKQNVAPADADLAAGEMAIWQDSTNGASKLMIKAKQADGTVKTGSVALA